MAKKAARIAGIILGIPACLFILLVIVLMATEYRPANREKAQTVAAGAASELREGSEVTLLTWNIGYAGLGAGSDFFMDGGKGVADADKETVQRYLSGIADTAFSAENKADITLFQEVDINSSRSHHIDESAVLAAGDAAYAANYSVLFIPYPIPPLGEVHAGLLTDSDYPVGTSERISLPCPFKWPVRLVNLKRCLLAETIPVEGTDRSLVVVNLHLEAYDDGSGKAAQTAVLKEFLASEYAKGNYVIAGGDFNQVFPGTEDVYPNTHAENWQPGTLDSSMIPDGFSLVWDSSVPSCRLDNQPYDASDKANTQYYVIDGFILSPNVSLKSVQTLDEGFENSDHNPVRMTVVLDG